MCENRLAMRKSVSLIAAAAALASTATAAPYYLPQPAGGALTRYDMQPVYTLEGIYSWAAKSHVPDMGGARIRFSLYSDGISSVRHQFSIATGYEAGRHTGAPGNHAVLGEALLADSALLSRALSTGDIVDIRNMSVTLQRLPITLGYDLNIEITDHVLLDFGARAGYAFGFAEGKIKDGTWSGLYNGRVYDSAPLRGYKEHLTTGGFTYALTAGVKIQFSQAIYTKLAYEFGRSYYTVHTPRHINFSQHSIVLAVGSLF